jgi:hypothetical protein
MNRRDAALAPLALGAIGLPLGTMGQVRQVGNPCRIGLLPNLGSVASKVF